jgi:hypothetical protein
METKLELKERLSTIRPLRDGGFVLTRGQEQYVASQAEVIEAMVLVGVVDQVFDRVKRIRQLVDTDADSALEDRHVLSRVKSSLPGVRHLSNR